MKNKQQNKMFQWNIFTNNKQAFTLVEILVAMTIFSIIMISVFMIFASASSISLKIDLTRAMQENTKNIVETIAKDLREQSLSWVSVVWGACTTGSWDWLCFENNSYFLAKKDGDDFTRVENSNCSDIKNNCYIVKSFSWSNIPLTNSLVAIKDLEFSVYGSWIEDIPRVVMKYTIQPAVRKWVNSSLIKESKINVQTTLSDRFIKTK